MTPALWQELIGLIARYVVPWLIAVVGLGSHMEQADAKRLEQILTSPEFITTTGATAVALWIGIRSWLAKTRTALTAAALSEAVPINRAAEISKVAAPLLSTPANQTPMLTSTELQRRSDRGAA